MPVGNQQSGSESGTLNRELPFHVGNWLVDPLNNELRLGDTCVKLEPKVMDVLLYLAQHPGQVVSREELEEHVWAGRIVTYDALTATIVKLRKAFQADPEDEPVIKTISKRGYSLVAPIHQSLPATEIQQQPAALVSYATTEATAQAESTASPQALNTKYAEPPHAQRTILTPRHLLLGAVVLAVLAISLSYVFLTPLPGNQREESTITDTVPRETLARNGGTLDPEAQSAFNAGWEKINKETPADYKIAIAFMQRAILLDPDYGQAHAALASIYWNTWMRNWHTQMGTSPQLQTKQLADAALQKAMQHPTPLAYQVASEILWVNRHYAEAIAEAHKAITLAPNNPLGHAALANALVFAGQPAEAKTSIDKAMQLDPYHPASFLFTLGLIHFCSGRDDKAAAVLEQAVRGSRENHLVYIPLIAAYGHLGQREKAASLLREVNVLRKAAQLPLLNVSTPIDPQPYQVWPFQNAGDVTRLQDGLRAAGLPEW